MYSLKETNWYQTHKNDIECLINDIMMNVEMINIPKSFGYEFYISEENLRDALLLHVYNYSNLMS
jgi:hypothetical protein